MKQPRYIFFAGNFLSKTRSTRSAGEELVDQLIRKDYPIIYASTYSNRFIRLFDLLFTSIKNRKKYEIAVIEVYSYLAFFWAEILLKLLIMQKKTTFLVLHGGGLVDFYRKKPTRVKKLFLSADKIITPSKYLKENFIHIRNDIIYIPNGIDILEYDFRIRELAYPSLVWFRAIHHIYNPIMAIKSINLLKTTYEKIHLQIVGPDKKDGSRGEITKFIIENGIETNIDFVGPIDKKSVSNWLNKSDIFLNTTNFESFGVSVVEAAASGLCIVTTNVGELSYLWEHEVDALLVSPDDPEAMAAAIQRILNEPELAARLSTNARKKAEQFDWSIILPQWEKVFEEVNQTHE
ncbi:MAG: glycosyl transferase family 1 [Chloroflexi bacterium HGW-Chloroflexi-2]|jgi:glycosyltransferase involved in cell wall biosynthesis|nr:MAG: glycosyl transferase family 1 [Chloroflexi bacterium HGW-Chloroflexi-2]